MVELIVVAALFFAIGLLLPDMIKKLIRKPKGYIRLGPKDEVDFTQRRSSRAAPARGDGPKPIRSKFDYLFDEDKKKDKPKIDLESVERSFRPDPKPANTGFGGPSGSGELKNNYLDFSHLESDISSGQNPGYNNNSNNNDQSQFRPNAFSGPSGFSQPSYPSQNPQPPAYSNSPFSGGSSQYSPSPSPSPYSGSSMTPSSPSPSFVGSTEEKKDDEEKEEKEHEWKPMGFFDD